MPPGEAEPDLASGFDRPTLPPGEPKTDTAIGAHKATLPPDGEICDALSTGTKVRYIGDYQSLEEIARGGPD